MEENNKDVVEETTEKVVEKKEQPRDEKGKFTSKKKIKDDGIVKVDLSKPPPVKEEVVEDKKENVVKEPEVVEEVTEQPIIEEITQEEKVEEIKQVAEEAIENMEATEKKLPENIQKLMEFMDKTGGDLNDYV